MRYGHTTGTKRETKTASNWYAEIEAQQIARIEAEQAAKDDAERALVTALATQVGHAVTAMPQAASRITKAATLVQHHDVYPLTSGNFLAGSQSDPVNAYLVERTPHWRCGCADHVHRGSYCKHIIAVWLTIKMGTAYAANYTLPNAA